MCPPNISQLFSLTVTVSDHHLLLCDYTIKTLEGNKGAKNRISAILHVSEVIKVAVKAILTAQFVYDFPATHGGQHGLHSKHSEFPSAFTARKEHTSN